MLQEVAGKQVYVVEFDEMPKLPITHSSEEEKPYALALARAIHNKIITEPGKYGIEIVEHEELGAKEYQIYRVEE